MVSINNEDKTDNNGRIIGEDIEQEMDKIIEEKKMDESPVEERKQCRDVYEELANELRNSRTVITMSLKFEMYVHE